MSWWKTKKGMDHVRTDGWRQEKDHSPIDSMALTQSRKRNMASDCCLAETKASGAEAMVMRLINSHLATLTLIQRTFRSSKRRKVVEAQKAAAAALPPDLLPARVILSLSERRRQLDMLEENYREARSLWLQEGVMDATAMRIRQIVVISGDPCSSPSWNWPYGTKVFRVAYPSTSPAAMDKADEEGLPYLWDGSPRSMVHVTADVASPKELIRKLAAAGFRQAQRSLIIIEGLQYLLSEDGMEHLFCELTRLAAPGSLLMLDFLHQDAFEGVANPKGFAATQQAHTGAGRPFLSALPADPDTVKFVLTPHGFHPLELLTPRDISARFLPQLPWSRWSAPLPVWHSFISAQKLRHTALFSDSNARDASPFNTAFRRR